ncbi:hypothetical protein ACQKP5_02185 [Pseudomonas vancouverensis]|uniref:hypothetical protein n=1 Tax=Pseudomonas vancouverensis TaxID=95300 RepID=UPI003CFD8451
MTSIHDQAMNYVYLQVFQRLLGFFSRAERTALQLLIQRLVVAAGGMEYIGEFKVLAIQNGTRDCCYTLTLLRAAQLSIASRSPTTFQLRIATQRSNATHPQALENMHRTFSALFVYDDPRVEVLMVDNREVLPFCHITPMTRAGRESNRYNLLMIEHRQVDSGPFERWDDGYLSTCEFYGQIARWQGGVDALVSSDSPRQQGLFIAGLRRAAAKAGLWTASPVAPGYASLFALIDQLGSDCYRALYADQPRPQWRPPESFETCRRTACIDIHDLLVSGIDERWQLSTEFLRFQPVDPMAQIAENEFTSVLISAHLQGLQACFMEGRSYESGVADYVQRTLVMMSRKRLPDAVCEQFMGVFGSPARFTQLREQASAEAQRHLDLNETQLVCLLHTPFIEKGARLEDFLRQHHTGMLVALPELHRAMQGHAVAEQVMQWMMEVSGLPVGLIVRLYGMSSVSAGEIVGVQSLADATVSSTDASGDANDLEEWSAGR